jgi:nitroreductase
LDGLEVILTRRSIRRYETKPVPEDVINTLLRAGMCAPSAMNRQPWELIVIRDAEIKKAASGIGPYWGMLKDAPLGILVLADASVCGTSKMYVQDCSAVTENILLAAHAMGLGGVWLGLYSNEERMREVRELFILPENIVPISMISIGYPAETKNPHTSFHAEKIHYDKY